MRAGDVIRFHYLHSLSEGNGNTITGLCTGLYRPNDLMGSFGVVFNLAGVPVNMKVKLNSPYLTSLERVFKGSGDLKYKLDYIWKLGKNVIPIAPVIKRSMMTREDEVKKSVKKNSKKKGKGEVIDDPLIVD